MYNKITLKKILQLTYKSLFAICFLAFSTLAVNAQIYTNGVLSSGATALNGTAAPAGFAWSECQNITGNTTVTNTNAGFGASVAAGNSVADDFTVPAGATWAINKITVYAYSTGSPATPSPFTDLRIKIHSGNPLTGTPAVAFGDLTTNRLTTATSAATYRIFNTLVPPTPTGITRLLWKLEANISTLLTPGTYWLEFQTGTALTSNFVPSSSPVGVRTLPGYNAIQKIGTTWAALVDGGSTSAGAAANDPVAVDIPFIVNYTPGVLSACTGTPTPGNTVSNVVTACTGVPFSLSLQNATAGSGVSYQWQTGTTATGPWNIITGATNATYASTVTATAFYRCIVTCAGSPGNSNPVQVSLTPVTGCYCANTATNIADEDIFNVTLGSLNNTSSCTSVGPGPGSNAALYNNYTSGTGAPAAPDVIAGANNPISIRIGTCGTGSFSNFTAVWIDLNQNGAFEATERLYVSPASIAGAHFEIGNLVIPATATLGITRMRVQVREFGSAATMLPCSNMTWGEVEDYNVNIVACTPVSITSQPASTSTACGNTATFTSGATGSLPSYQWQYRTSATGLWQLVPNAAPYAGVNTNTLTVSVDPSLNGYQYRNAILGGCVGSATDFTTAGTLTVTPVQLSITPASITKCLAAAPVLISTPSTQSVLTFTNSTPGLIADGIVAGITRSVTVTGVTGPIQKIRVKLNATGEWVGDMVASLKAPNGQIVNMSHLTNGSNNSSPGTPPGSGNSGFINTFFNFNRVMRGTPFSGGGVVSPAAQGMNLASAPYSNEYPIDNQQAQVFVGVPTGPTGLDPTTNNINTFYTHTPATASNGVWTLGMYDAGPPDPINFLNYTLEITFGGAPATMILTPSTGLFTDAAGTLPYTGNAVTQLYAAPVANITYSAVISAGPCATLPQSIVVNVNSSVGGTATLADAALCQGGNATFALGGTLTGGPAFTHNYQVSTDNGVTFTNIANGGVYSGATTNTLVITGAPASFNGYKYRDSINTAGSCGFLKSTVGTLTVNATPTVTISAAPVTKLFPGLTSTLTAAVSPAPSATNIVTYQWFKDGAPVTAAQPSNKYLVNIDGLGTYTVKVVDGSGCFTSLTTPTDISISDSTNRNVLFIYPSPNTGKFQVRYFFDNNTATTSNASINIYDEKGTRVYTRSFSPGLGYGQMNVDLGTHGKGVYRVDLLNSNGERLKTGSVLVF